MNYLKQALTEYLSGLTTKKNDKEIWTKNAYGDPMTIEPVDDENYIARIYWESGQLYSEGLYKNGQINGIYKEWYCRGGLRLENLYENGKFVKRIK